MSKILGLDIGTNSIGWAIVDTDNKQKIKAGSRIIPMDEAALGKFEEGKLVSQTAERTRLRGIRRLNERAELRRERLLRVLNVLNFLPEHYAKDIDFENRLGQFKEGKQPLIAYKPTENGKREFLFIDSFSEMLEDFKTSHSELVADNKKIPYDWTIYYLRKKALTQPISKEELAWILLNFNTKRGYYQLRGKEKENTNKKEEENTNKKEEYAVLTVTDVVNTGADRKKPQQNWYEITYDREGCVQKKLSINPPKKIGDEVELIITTTISKSGEVKVSLREPKEDDWTLQKKRTEHLIDAEKVTIGQYIYDKILANPDVKIRGKLVNVVERKYYKKELEQILETQIKYIPELQDKDLLFRCYKELYRNNDIHVQTMLSQGFKGLFLNDILFYQRPLKSKKSEIADCPFEYHTYRDKEGKLQKKYLKCTSKSNPYFQEFRLWQFIQNLKIYAKTKEVDGKLKANYDITDELIQTDEDRAALFDWLNNKKDVKQEQVLKYFKLDKQNKEYKDQYYWNYVQDNTYPCNTTHYLIISALNKIGEDTIQLNFKQEYALWHILYSINDPVELEKALGTFAQKNNLDEVAFVDAFKKTKPFASDYAAFSEKAIKKFLPLMRCGKYWKKEDIDEKTKQRIEKIVNGEVDDTISDRVREKAKELTCIEDCCFLPQWLASYIVYNRHSDSKWEKPEDIDKFLKDFKQHSLRNPVVESVLLESVRVVRDIYKEFGKVEEVHIEMGRDLKQTKDQRVAATKKILENQKKNLRIRMLLQGFASSEVTSNDFQSGTGRIENVRPYSPSQQEILSIYEDYVLSNNTDIPEEIQEILKKIDAYNVSSSDILRYSLWLEQKYKSPYTGEMIPLSKLFTPAYEIEHIIPQSRYFDNSFNNKVICESEINKNKGNKLAYEYIIDAKGKVVEGSYGKNYKILSKVEYEEFIKQNYSYNKKKMSNLLLEDIPASFTERQLNDSRYIARKALEVFSHLTKTPVVATNGSVTTELKKHWGINDVWNNIIYPRFERLNKKENSNRYGSWVNKDGKSYFQTTVPLELSKDFSKKRIDHRHHAMDAIIIACTTRDMVNYLSNASGTDVKNKDERKKLRCDLRNKLCYKDRTDEQGNDIWRFYKPWDKFTQDVEKALNNVVVSFKQDLRVINKTNNYYQHYENGKKVIARQTKGDSWAIRKSLHKDTISGKVRLQQIKEVKWAEVLKTLDNINLIFDKDLRKEIRKIASTLANPTAKDILNSIKQAKYIIGGKEYKKVKIYYLPEKAEHTAHRVVLDDTFTRKDIEESITDSGIRKILLNHLDNYYNGDCKAAFSPEGIEELNKNIKQLNGGKDHKPIRRVRILEPLGAKFSVGYEGAKAEKFVFADKGTNLFFAIYKTEDGKREYASIPFYEAVERQKQGLPVAPDTNENGSILLFTLSPLDLVYMPDEEENIDLLDIKNLDTSKIYEKIYKFVSFTGNQAFFVPCVVAKPIANKSEFNALNKIELDDNGRSIKENCYKLDVDRLGNITKIYKY